MVNKLKINILYKSCTITVYNRKNNILSFIKYIYFIDVGIIFNLYFKLNILLKYTNI